ncbi:MAG TPA: 23S rRNA (pseudouridine(1915)-N(3))-methyltransferase RlmH [Burkholderiaceae bacterium]|nr:23S rRNA (pseudouridine(1915)-N(3))-methyltransferase RlmH [Burkholderiaceae bacterium]
MRITIAAVGTRMPAWADQAVQDYLDRFPRDFEVTLKQVRPEARRQQPVQHSLRGEQARLSAAIAGCDRVVALDERGSDWTTAHLAQQIGRWRDASEHAAFLIGGPDGLSEQLKTRAQLKLRLSGLTLPHALARVVLVEQLYRAWSILANHPYHRA